MVMRARVRDDVAAAPAAPAVHGTRNSSAVVTVACKIPTGVVLQLCREVKFLENVRGDVREMKRFDRYGPQVRLHGPAYPVGPAPKGFPERPTVAGGYALTFNVSKDFWDEWLRQNRDTEIVMNKMVFAHEPNMVRGLAREHAEVRSGLEPVNPEGDPRVPRPRMPGVGGIEIADEAPNHPAAATEE